MSKNKCPHAIQHLLVTTDSLQAQNVGPTLAGCFNVDSTLFHTSLSPVLLIPEPLQEQGDGRVEVEGARPQLANP